MGSTDLPVPLTSFIGRERELADLKRLLSTSRLVTLTGAGGCGKTRLAVQVAHAVSASFADGAWLVDLAPLRDPGLVAQLVTQTLGIPRGPEQPVLETLLHHLQSKEMLLVIDNCEHLVFDCARLAQQILSQTTGVRILATSRETLAIAGERVYPLSGLAFPTADMERTGSPQDFMQYGAVRLFFERARAVLPDFLLTAANAASMVQICRRLDGLPLALELASARCNVLTLQQIAERLDDRFSLLVSRQRGEPRSRHETLRAAIDWSFESLSTPERAALRRLSVFAGGCSLSTAEAVCAGDGVDPQQVLELLSSLINRSLVVAQTQQGGEARYRLLETIRQYAQEKLEAAGEEPRIRDRHLQCFLNLAEETAPKISGPQQQMWLAWLDGEHDNFRAALAWSLEGGVLPEDELPGRRIEAGLRIAIALYQFWTIRDDVVEGFAWYERLVARMDERISPVIRANVLAYASFMAGFRGNTAAQMRYGQDAVNIAEAAGENGRPALLWALSAQGFAARAAGDFQTEFALGKRGIQLNREIGDPYNLALRLTLLSPTAMALGEYAETRAMLEEGLALLRTIGNPYRIAMALNYSGDLARCEKNYAQAQLYYEESIALLRPLDAVRDLASVLHNLAYTCLHLGDFGRAHALLQESMQIQQAQRNSPGLAECLAGFAALAVERGLPAAGARLLAAAAVGGQRFASAWAATRMEYEQTLALVRARLPAAQFQAEQAAGQALQLEQAAAYARNLPLEPPAPPGSPKSTNPLTARERSITALIAQGRSNGEIAIELVLSKRTVEKHIANILLKLGFTNRSQIVRWAVEKGLVNSVE